MLEGRKHIYCKRVIDEEQNLFGNRPVVAPWKRCKPIKIVASDIELAGAGLQSLQLAQLLINYLQNTRWTIFSTRFQPFPEFS